jgi:hypothetical protein
VTTQQRRPESLQRALRIQAELRQEWEAVVISERAKRVDRFLTALTVTWAIAGGAALAKLAGAVGARAYIWQTLIIGLVLLVALASMFRLLRVRRLLARFHSPDDSGFVVMWAAFLGLAAAVMWLDGDVGPWWAWVAVLPFAAAALGWVLLLAYAVVTGAAFKIAAWSGWTPPKPGDEEAEYERLAEQFRKDHAAEYAELDRLHAALD